MAKYQQCAGSMAWAKATRAALSTVLCMRSAKSFISGWYATAVVCEEPWAVNHCPWLCTYDDTYRYPRGYLRDIPEMHSPDFHVL